MTLSSNESFIDAIRAAAKDEITPQQRYEAKIAKTLFKTLFGTAAGFTNAKIRDLTIEKLNDEYLSGTVFGAFRSSVPITVHGLFGINRALVNELFSFYADVLSTYTNAVAIYVIVDKHGDGVGDIVLHTDQRLLDVSRESSKSTVTIVHDKKCLYVTCLSDMLAYLSQNPNRFIVR